MNEAPGKVSPCVQTVNFTLTPSDIARFWSRVKKCIDPKHPDCLDFCGSLNAKGYGMMNLNYRATRAHRISWVIHFGQIPNGKCVRHKCDRPICVNPDHLEVGTSADNTADMMRRGRGCTGDNHGSKTKPESVTMGEDQWNSKLTEEQVVEIRARYASGERLCDIYKEYGVTKGNLSAIVRRFTWKHVP